jgi:hypothetical protein
VEHSACKVFTCSLLPGLADQLESDLSVFLMSLSLLQHLLMILGLDMKALMLFDKRRIVDPAKKDAWQCCPNVWRINHICTYSCVAQLNTLLMMSMRYVRLVHEGQHKHGLVNTSVGPPCNMATRCCRQPGTPFLDWLLFSDNNAEMKEARLKCQEMKCSGYLLCGLHPASCGVRVGKATQLDTAPYRYFPDTTNQRGTHRNFYIP